MSKEKYTIGKCYLIEKIMLLYLHLKWKKKKSVKIYSAGSSHFDEF